MAKLDEAHAEFLSNPFYGVVATLRADGSPHQTVVWVDTDNGDVIFNTAEGRAKPKHLRATPHVSLTVVDPANGYHWVGVGYGGAVPRGRRRAHRQAREEVPRRGLLPVPQGGRAARDRAHPCRPDRDGWIRRRPLASSRRGGAGLLGPLSRSPGVRSAAA